MLRRKDREKVQLVLPSKDEIKQRMETYKSDVKTTDNLVFIDDSYLEELSKFKLNSVYVSDGFELSQYKDKDKFFVRLTSAKNGNPKMLEGRFENHYIELEFDTYEDLLTFCDNVYTRNGITQSDGLHVLETINSKSFVKGIATATTVAGGFFLLNKFLKKQK